MELDEALQRSERSKSPGWDGLTVELYLALWDDIKDVLLHVINVAWQQDHLPLSWKHGIVKLVPKKHLCETVSDWRPTTLMLVLYKSIAKMLLHRISGVLSCIRDFIPINTVLCPEDKFMTIFAMHWWSDFAR